MTAVSTAIPDRQTQAIPWWKAHWKALVVIPLVASAFVYFRPRGETARARAYSVMHRPGVSLIMVDNKLEHAKFELAPGLESPNSNLGWAFQQLSRFPEVKSVETRCFLSVNLPVLRSLTNLESFAIDERTDIVDGDLDALAGLKSLNTLTLSGEELTPRGLRYLKALPNLKSLKLIGPKMVGAGFETVGEFANLESLSIESGRAKWKDPLVLGSPPKLKILRLANMDLRNGSAKSQDQLQSLEELYLANVAVDADFFRGLSKLPRLKVLKIRSAGDPFDSYADVIASFSALETLYLADAGNHKTSNWISGKSVEKLSQLKKLEELAFCSTRIGDRGVVATKEFSRLKRLKLLDVGMSRSALPVLYEMPRIEQISLYEPGITPQVWGGMKPQGEMLKFQETLAKKNVEVIFSWGFWGVIW